MNTAEVLADAFERIQESVHGAVEGLSEEALSTRLDGGANSIAWLVWHLSRIQDDHVAGAAGLEQVWITGGWADRFGLPFPEGETGYGQNSKQVTQVRVGADLLLGYFDAVHEQTAGFVRGLDDAALDRVVDETWSPPVTLGVRLVSVIADDLQHAGQVAFVRGALARR
ncbi:DUF664 domain-containing protein [Streptomyces sp. NBC_01014]|uniref:mycothiol transferase n=1 Tax=Streptomyces sp. NBC_01014 TaxID=2903719 RepID=UPI00386D97C5|nr:DinB family protein [Streptomyces sp. NBC_01014]